MRRVYYSFGLRLVVSRAFLSGTALAIGLYGIKVMVHVASFFNNLQTVGLRSVDNFVYNALTQTDVYTLLFVGIVVFSLLSFNFSVFKSKPLFKMQTV